MDANGAERSIFRHRRKPFPLWVRPVMVGWALAAALVGIATAQHFGDCFENCPPLPQPWQQDQRVALVSVAMGAWFALPALVVAGLRWRPVRLAIALLALVMLGLSVAAAQQPASYVLEPFPYAWPASLLVGLGALVRWRESPERFARATRLDVLIACVAVSTAYGLLLTDTGPGHSVASTVAIAVSLIAVLLIARELLARRGTQSRAS